MAIYQIKDNAAIPMGVNGMANAYLQTDQGLLEIWANYFVPKFTGSYAVFGDKEKGYIELYTSGTLTLAKGVYDLFGVGGGAGRTYANKGGSGSGYTTTQRQLELEGEFPVLIGAGGVFSYQTVETSPARGGDTTVGTILFAKGGTMDRHGGSGGGGNGSVGEYDYAGNGGSNGSNGFNGWDGYDVIKGGSGQGTTTRAFEETTGKLYAGGGAGAVFGDGKKAVGGAGGGGDQMKNGTPNTGGGAGAGGLEPEETTGGSGIIVIRWGY